MLPKWTISGSYSILVPEDQPTGSVLTTVSASDDDSVDNNHGRVTYKTIAGSSSKFQLNPETGDITLLMNLDRETVAEHIVVVEASDSDMSATATVTIAVSDVNDNPPVFSKTHQM